MKQYIILLILLVSGVLTAAPAFAQKSGTKHTVTGKVTDQSGEPLIGATVLVTPRAIIRSRFPKALR